MAFPSPRWRCDVEPVGRPWTRGCGGTASRGWRDSSIAPRDRRGVRTRSLGGDGAHGVCETCAVVIRTGGPLVLIDRLRADDLTYRIHGGAISLALIRRQYNIEHRDVSSLEGRDADPNRAIETVASEFRFEQ